MNKCPMDFMDGQEGVYRIHRPRNPLPLIYDSPHSGTIYPADFGHVCSFDSLVGAEDKYVGELFDHVPAHGGTLLEALFPRSYIDVNRPEDDIDPELLSEPWEGEARPTARSHAGIGLVRRLIRPGVPVYGRMLLPGEIARRIARFYQPYHAALSGLLDKAHYNYGQVWHINCHSMPSRGAFSAQVIPQMDFVLGDRDGTSCDCHFTFEIKEFLKSLGYKVAINDPYKGVEIVRRYGQPGRGRHSIQIEINRALYMHEGVHKKSRNYSALKGDLEKLSVFLADYAQSNLTDMAAD